MKKSEIVKEIIESRSSIFPKDYSGEDIPQEVLEEILNSSNYAPNHKRTKPWRFRIFKGEEKLNLGKELQRLYKEITPEQLFFFFSLLKYEIDDMRLLYENDIRFIKQF